jgi:hypothetical protein
MHSETIPPTFSFLASALDSACLPPAETVDSADPHRGVTSPADAGAEAPPNIGSCFSLGLEVMSATYAAESLILATM